jgi:hypothetical protein
MKGLMFSAAFFDLFWQGPLQFANTEACAEGFSPTADRRYRETGTTEMFDHSVAVRPNAAGRHSRIGRRRETKIAADGLNRKARMDLVISPT